MAACTETLMDLAVQLTSVVNSATPDSEKTAAATSIAKQILKAAKGPAPDWMERAFNNVEIAALKLFLDWGAFEIIPERGTITFNGLAKKLSADVSLIRRITWVLVAGGTLRQHGEDQIAHTSVSRQYLPGTPDGLLLQMIYDEHMLPALKLPEYFSEYGRREPVDRLHTPHAYAVGQPDKEIWEIQKQNPERMKRFIKAMEVSQKFIPMIGIYDFSWVKSKLSESPDRIVFVDVGGGKGHMIKAVMNENPFIRPKNFMLEDRDEVINEVIQMKEPELNGVQLKVHDFHQPQPVRNALIYYIRRCLHDYGDDVCAKMLTHLSDAMASDSKVLISEYVLSNPPTPLGAMTDFGMLEIGGKERTANDWDVLVARAGLKVEKIHGLDQRMQVLECIKI
ncbi:O-methyltransferase [Colletotrichum karsti]|uniref:O-methyltransferase n=1 Tax=Colletotrichum karsti TaxID=1095194 RepID=A0A9P6LGW0_9PEZI|nr:O-methyltransferase [Colletotrichum karsti]KAF9871862.1 O-methyltransferase [Colletotrichum karsti]